ncbi:MAG TPA: glycosyltransferase family 39 protein [Candidatus Acidoferrales bacterium]|nr:glycosyltransferase family 39 protein [Candidatus Acidoferrales bacterium]
MRKLLLFSILFLAAVLLIFRINELMPFIGDQGWFYLAARDVVFGKSYPLVGITASHLWLHQGAYWTYILVFMLWLFHFEPLSGAYMTIVLGVISVYLIYLVGKLYFSENVGTIASFLYATSPLVIINARTPYHTSPIPFFTLLFLLALLKWVKGNRYYFSICIFLLAVLYNFELATTTLGISFFIVLFYGIWKKTSWIKIVRDKKVILLSIIAWFVPMSPMLLYDIHHGFPQTLKFTAWIIYHILLIFGFPSIHTITESTGWSEVFAFALQQYQMLIFAMSGIIACIILITTFGFFYYRFYQTIKHKKYHIGMILVGVMNALLILGYLANKTTSGAYVPVIFPFILLLTAYVVDKFKRRYFFITILLLIAIGILNIYSLLKNNYFEYITYAQRLHIAKIVTQEANGRDYNIKAKGPGSWFPNFDLNYDYLTWWLGHGPSDKPEKLIFFIGEDHKGIHLSKRD